MSAQPDREALLQEFSAHLDAAQTLDAIHELKIAWVGRKGRLTHQLKELGQMSIEDRRVFGPILNQLKLHMDQALTSKELTFIRLVQQETLEQDTLDITLPGGVQTMGRIHPLMQVMESLVTIFRSLGFVVADGPEIESEFHNFEALNVPADHPARDMQDTFYIERGIHQLTLPNVQDRAATREGTLLRTHTSPVQVRVMEKFTPPLAVIVPGRVYRHEAQDATHSATFHQLEGLLVDKNVSFAELKGTLARFAQLFFAPNVKTRFRPSFFPFTEPSAQIDVSCMICNGAGCRICKNSGWIELMGAGMVNPNVFKAVGYDPGLYSGFAFGMGVERLAMIKYGVDDLRAFYENDIRFLDQF